MNARKGMSSDSRGTKTTAYFDKLDESSAASVSLVEGLIILEQENKIKPQKFKSNVRLFEIFFKTKDVAEKIEGIPAVN